MMFNRVLITLDGSDRAWRAFPVADDLAARLGAPLELLYVTAFSWEVNEARKQLMAALDSHELHVVAAPTVSVLVQGPTPAATIADHAAHVPGTLLVMSTLGRGRTATVAGSVTTDVLRMTHGPVVAVGGRARTDRPSEHDQLVIPVDGSAFSEVAVPLGAAMAKALGARPWLVTNIDPQTPPVGDVLDSNYPHAMARRVAELTGGEAEYEALHERHAGQAVADFAAAVDAGLIVCSTHGRTGWGRLALGSVGTAIVHEASCPVVLVRPPALPTLTHEELAAEATPPTPGG